MYQRRLLLLVIAMLVIALFPAVWMARLTLVRGAQHRFEAEKRLVNEEWLPTVRGQITDRKGRVLALDRPSYEIAVDYPVITGQWADTMAAKAARAASLGEWKRLSPEQRDELIRKKLPPYEAHLEQMWDTLCKVGGLTREQLDDRRAQIRSEVQLLAATVTERQRLERQQELRDAEALSDEESSLPEVRTSDVLRPIKEQSEPHVLIRNVSDNVGFEFERLRGQTVTEPGRPTRTIALLPGLHVLDAKRREYPFDTVDVPVNTQRLPSFLRREGTQTVRVEGVATHLIGWMRSQLFREDIQKRPLKNRDGELDLGHYRPGDSIGQGGLEQASEDRLRGLRGVRTTHLDTGRIETIPPQRGEDTPLTIDVLLQARLQALFNPGLGLTIVQPWHKPKNRAEELPGKIKAKELPLATPLNGAIVVLDIESGDVLSMVSVPSFGHGQLETDARAIFGDQYAQAYLNRAIERPYPPGSIVKPLILAEAVTQHKYSTSERVPCTGHFFPDKPLMYRCWIYKQNKITHSAQLGHDLDGSDGVKCSCNIFFFEMGKRLGPQGVFEAYSKFGVGSRSERSNIFGAPVSEMGPGTGLIQQHRGSVPDPSKTNINISDAILMGIGQGPVLWTPLQAADAFATLARGGIKLTPRVLASAAQLKSDLHLDPSGVAQALDGLWRCANEDLGTTHTLSFDLPDGGKLREKVFTAPGIDVWAKSGTADAPPFVADLDFNGAHEAFDGDHAWCVFLVGTDRTPKYAVSVVVEYGGSGGKVAGPVANQVVHALIDEGYLPDLRTDAEHSEGDRP